MHLKNSSLVSEFLTFIQFMPFNERVWLAGGAARSYITNEPVSDFDLFFEDVEDAKIFNDLFVEMGYGVNTFTCPKGELYSFKFTYSEQEEATREDKAAAKLRGLKVQLITKRDYENVNDLLDSFDFTVTQFAIEVTNPRLRYTARIVSVIASDQAREDAFNRVLRINKITYPVATLNRIRKYMDRGYYPENNFEFWKGIVEKIHDTDWDVEDLQLYLD